MAGGSKPALSVWFVDLKYGGELLVYAWWCEVLDGAVVVHTLTGERRAIPLTLLREVRAIEVDGNITAGVG